MNSSSVRRKLSRTCWSRPWQSGHSLVELALVMPVLLLLAFGAGDFGRVFYVALGLNNAARAGAQYGSQNTITAADTTGMVNAAKQDDATLAGLSVTASQCTCKTGSTVAACAANYCTNSPQSAYVTVTTTAPFTAIAAQYPGIPQSMTLSRTAIMQVGQQ